MKYSLFIFIFNFIIVNIVTAQEAEHNYLVGPQVTNCDSLDINGLSLTKSISLIRASIYRFDQSFRLTRKKGLQLGEYYSCDNKEGYLIIKYDGEEKLYHSVDKILWNELISSSDPERYYLNKILQLRKYH